MSALIKMNQIEKDRFCENIYEQYIVEASEFLIECENISKIIRAYIPCGCYTNFRDALFHFRCLVISVEETKVACQAFAIKEHTNRAKTDAIISLIDNCAEIIKKISTNNNLSKDVETLLKRQYSILKDALVKYRIGGMMLENTDILRPTCEHFFEIIKDFFECMEKNVQEEFMRAVKEMREEY